MRVRKQTNKTKQVQHENQISARKMLHMEPGILSVVNKCNLSFYYC